MWANRVGGVKFLGNLNGKKAIKHLFSLSIDEAEDKCISASQSVKMFPVFLDGKEVCSAKIFFLIKF